MFDQVKKDTERFGLEFDGPSMALNRLRRAIFPADVESPERQPRMDGLILWTRNPRQWKAGADRENAGCHQKRLVVPSTCHTDENLEMIGYCGPCPKAAESGLAT